MTRHLVQTCNLRKSCPSHEIILFGDGASGSFRHVKLNPQVAATHEHAVDQIIYMPIGSVVGAKLSPHDWEVFAQSCCKLAEHLQSSPDLPTIMHKHSTIVNLIKRPMHTEKCPHLLVHATADSINKGVDVDNTRGLTKTLYSHAITF